jgi:hypothetical protein
MKSAGKRAALRGGPKQLRALLDILHLFVDTVRKRLILR